MDGAKEYLKRKSDFERLSKRVTEMVQVERERQNDKWGFQRHDFGTWLMILMEEVGEVAQTGQIGMMSEKPSDKADRLTELIQVQAVAQAMAEQYLEEMEGMKI